MVLRTQSDCGAGPAGRSRATISRSMRPSLSRSPAASPRPSRSTCQGGPARSETSSELARAVAQEELGGHRVGDRRAVVVDVAVGLRQVEAAVVVGVERGEPEAEHEAGRRGEAGRG